MKIDVSTTYGGYTFEASTAKALMEKLEEKTKNFCCGGWVEAGGVIVEESLNENDPDSDWEILYNIYEEEDDWTCSRESAIHHLEKLFED